MIINKISLQNIFTYYGATTISFSKKNIVNGDNGFGKTSFLNSIKFLFGKSFQLKNLLNYNIKKEEIAFVEMELYNPESNEIIIAKKYLQNSIISTEVSINGYRLIEEEAETFLNTIIPVEIADYISFDGEKINEKGVFSKSTITNTFDIFHSLNIYIKIIQDSKQSIVKIKNDSINKEDLVKYKDYNTKKEVLDVKLLKYREDLSILNDELRVSDNKISKMSVVIDNSLFDFNSQEKVLKKEFDEIKNKYLFKMFDMFIVNAPLYYNDKLKNNKSNNAFDVSNQKAYAKLIADLSKDLSIDSDKLMASMNSLNSTNLFDLENFNISKIEELIDNGISLYINNRKDLKELSLNKKESIKKINSTDLEELELEKEKQESLTININKIKNKILEDEENLSLIVSELNSLFTDSKNSQVANDSIEVLQDIIEEASYQYVLASKQCVEDFNNILNKSESITKFKEIHNVDNININIDEQGNKKLYIEKNNVEYDLDFLSAGQKHMLSFFLLNEYMSLFSMFNFIIVDTPLGRLSEKNQQTILEIYNSFEQVILLTTTSEFNNIKDASNYNLYNIEKNDNGSYFKKEIL